MLLCCFQHAKQTFYWLCLFYFAVTSRPHQLINHTEHAVLILKRNFQVTDES